MSSIVFTPRKANKTEAQGRNDMKRVLADPSFQRYYIDDQDGNMARSNETKKPASTQASPKTKKPAARKRNAPTPKSTGSTSSQESPSKRKSDRIAAGIKRTAKAIESDEASSAESSPNKKRKTGILAGFLTENKVEPAHIQKHTGRFKPMKAQIRPGKKIETKAEKRPADSDDAATAIQSRPSKRAKKTHAASGLSQAQIASDTLEMSIGAAAETDQDGTAKAEDTPTPTKGKSKAKGKAKKSTPSASVSVSDQEGSEGSSTQRPADATLETPWKCANGNCNTGQTWHERKTHGRKVVSDYFGRNKKETSLIDDDVWHYSCRKDYQRKSYNAKKQCREKQSEQPMCEFKIKGIEMQLLRIQLWRPEATFKVQLSKQAKERLTDYYKELINNYKELINNNNDEAQAEQAVAKTPKTKADGTLKPLEDWEKFPIKKMKEFDTKYCKPERYDFGGLKKIIKWIRRQVVKGSIDCVVPMELLITKQTDDEEFTDPRTNYDLWTAHLDSLDNGQERDADDEETGSEDGDAVETESSIAGPSGTRHTSAHSEETEVAIKTESDIAGPSGTQNTSADSDETEVAASEAGEADDATTQQAPDEGDIPDFESYVAETPVEAQAPDEGDIPDFESYKAETPLEDRFPDSTGGYENEGGYDSDGDYDSDDGYDSDDYYDPDGGYDYSIYDNAARLS